MLAVTNSSAPSTTSGWAISVRKSLGDLDGRHRGPDVAQHDDELVAAEPAEHVAIAHDSPQTLAHPAQQLVADTMTEAVVDDLEVVEVDEHHRDRTGLAGREESGELVEEPEAVGKPGQFVVGRRPFQPLGTVALLGDVLDVGDGQAAAVAVVHHRHPCPRPHDALILADVALFHVVRIGRDARQCASRRAASRRDG